MLAMIALLIGYEAVSRLIAPVPIAFEEAIPIAVLGLVVNIASVRLLSGGNHGRGGRNEVSLSEPFIRRTIPCIPAPSGSMASRLWG